MAKPTSNISSILALRGDSCGEKETGRAKLVTPSRGLTPIQSKINNCFHRTFFLLPKKDWFPS